MELINAELIFAELLFFGKKAYFAELGIVLRRFCGIYFC